LVTSGLFVNIRRKYTSPVMYSTVIGVHFNRCCITWSQLYSISAPVSTTISHYLSLLCEQDF